MTNGTREAGLVLQGSFAPRLAASPLPGAGPGPPVDPWPFGLRAAEEAPWERAPAPAAPSSGPGAGLPARLLQASRGGGAPLPAEVRREMESLFQVGFEEVRVHVNGFPAAVGALAFTSGSDLYFAPGHYDPGTSHGRQLIAHELTHVVQQRSGRVRSPSGPGVTVVDDPALEAEARQMAVRALTPGIPACLPGAPQYRAGVSPAQNQRDMRVVQRMHRRSTRSQSFADQIGEYGTLWELTALRLKVGADLYHTSDANLQGVSLRPPAFLTGPGQASYGGKQFAFTVARETCLVLLNDRDNLADLLELMGGSNTEEGDALVEKAGGVLDGGGRLVSFSGVKTVGTIDKLLAAWFETQDIPGWYVDSAKSGGMKFDEVMLTDTSILSTGKRY